VLGGPKKRAVLALLVLEAGRVMPAGRWASPPSPTTPQLEQTAGPAQSQQITPRGNIQDHQLR
jgi:hypothetical protein